MDNAASKPVSGLRHSEHGLFKGQGRVSWTWRDTFRASFLAQEVEGGGSVGVCCGFVASCLLMFKVAKVHLRAPTSSVGVLGAFILIAMHSSGGIIRRKRSSATCLAECAWTAASVWWFSSKCPSGSKD